MTNNTTAPAMTDEQIRSLKYVIGRLEIASVAPECEHANNLRALLTSPRAAGLPGHVRFSMESTARWLEGGCDPLAAAKEIRVCLAKLDAAPAAPVAEGAPDQNTELARITRMFMAACNDLGLINEALGLDPDDGGAEPILDAIQKLKDERDQWADAGYAAQAVAADGAATDELRGIIEACEGLGCPDGMAPRQFISDIWSLLIAWYQASAENKIAISDSAYHLVTATAALMGERAAVSPATAEKNEWKDAVDAELVTIQSTADTYAGPKEAVKALIDWHVQVALDPAVSAAARSLQGATADTTWKAPKQHCQNGGDVCLAGNRDGVCCPEDSCDIDDGTRKNPATADEREKFYAQGLQDGIRIAEGRASQAASPADARGLSLMRKAFRVTEVRGDPDPAKQTFTMRFSFRSIEALHAADDEWRKFIAAPADAREPDAYLVTDGRLYRSKAFLDKGEAEKSVAQRNDGSRIEPLYRGSVPADAGEAVAMTQAELDAQPDWIKNALPPEGA